MNVNSKSRSQAVIPGTKTSDLPYDYLFKIVVVGDCDVGKSCLLQRFADNKFQSKSIATIGVDFKIRTLARNGKITKLQIWDTAGQERFRSLPDSIFSGANGIIIVYDVTNQSSFDNIDSWFKRCKAAPNHSAKILLVGNKSDLPKVVSDASAKAFADAIGLSLIITSAKSSENVELAFLTMADEIQQDLAPPQAAGWDDRIRVTKLVGTEVKPAPRWTCC